MLLIRNIHGVSSGNVDILGGHSIGHSKQKSYMYMCPSLNVFRDRAISLHSCKIVHKEILSIVSNIGIYYSSDKVGAVYLVQYIFENSVNIGSGTTFAEAVNIRHISIFGICEDVRHFAQHSYNVIINSHNY